MCFIHLDLQVPAYHHNMVDDLQATSTPNLDAFIVVACTPTQHSGTRATRSELGLNNINVIITTALHSQLIRAGYVNETLN